MIMKHRLMIVCLCSLPVGFSIFSARLTGAATSQSQQSTNQSEDVRTLAPGATVERNISGGESHFWQIKLSAGDYLRLSITHKTRKLAASLYAPGTDGTAGTNETNRENERKPLLSTTDQNVIFEHDSHLKQTETFSFVAEVSGAYRLETSLLDKNLAHEQYEVKIGALRPATQNDRLRVIAERGELEGDLAEDSDMTLEGQLQNIAKYETSLGIWRELGERKNELRLLRRIGQLYRPLGEIQTSLKYYSQAIQLARDIGDRFLSGANERSLDY